MQRLIRFTRILNFSPESLTFLILLNITKFWDRGFGFKTSRIELLDFVKTSVTVWYWIGGSSCRYLWWKYIGGGLSRLPRAVEWTVECCHTLPVYQNFVSGIKSFLMTKMYHAVVVHFLHNVRFHWFQHQPSCSEIRSFPPARHRKKLWTLENLMFWVESDSDSTANNLLYTQWNEKNGIVLMVSNRATSWLTPDGHWIAGFFPRDEWPCAELWWISNSIVNESRRLQRARKAAGFNGLIESDNSHSHTEPLWYQCAWIHEFWYI